MSNGRGGCKCATEWLVYENGACRQRVWQILGGRGSLGTGYPLAMDLDSSGRPYVLFKSYAGAQPLEIRRFGGQTWELIGTTLEDFPEVVMSENTLGLDVVVDSQDVVYAFMQRRYAIGQTYVYKYDGSSWSVLGGQPILDDYAADYGRMAVTTDGVLYAAVMEDEHPVFIYKFDGNDWSLSGQIGENMDDYLDLALDNNDVPYVVVKDRTPSPDVYYVYKLDGDSWVQVGDKLGPENTGVFYAQIGFDTQNNLYVGLTTTAKSAVYKFAGGNWETVGEFGFAGHGIIEPAFAVSSEGTLFYVGNNPEGPDYDYYDTAWWFNGSEWVTLGPADFTDYDTYRNHMEIDSSNTPYVFTTELTYRCTFGDIMQCPPLNSDYLLAVWTYA